MNAMRIARDHNSTLTDASAVERAKHDRPRTVAQSDRKMAEQEVINTLQKIESHLCAIREASTHSAREWLTVQDAANELQVSQDTIERLIGLGRIQAAEISTEAGRGIRRRFRIRREWLVAYLVSTVRPHQPANQPRISKRRSVAQVDFIGG